MCHCELLDVNTWALTKHAQGAVAASCQCSLVEEGREILACTRTILCLLQARHPGHDPKTSWAELFTYVLCTCGLLRAR